MAEIIEFPDPPAPDPPLLCGWLDHGPFHVWPDVAKYGDPCVCGAVTMSIDPIELIAAIEA